MTKSDWIGLIGLTVFTLAGIYGIYNHYFSTKLANKRFAFLEDIMSAIGALSHQDSEDIRRDKVNAISDEINACDLFKEHPSYKTEYEAFSAELNEHLQKLIQASPENDFTMLHEQARGMLGKFEEIVSEPPTT